MLAPQLNKNSATVDTRGNPARFRLQSGCSWGFSVLELPFGSRIRDFEVFVMPIMESKSAARAVRSRVVDNSPMKRRFLSDSAVPAGLRKKVDEACRLLKLSLKRHRHCVARQMRLRHDYGGLYVAYLPARNGVYIIATAKPGIEDIHARIEEAGGITRAERSKVVIEVPMPGDDGQAYVWSPRAAREM
jgi:hypothetical protein